MLVGIRLRPSVAPGVNYPGTGGGVGAAKTTDAPTIKVRLVDPDYPLGRAVNLTVCRGEFCSQVCQGP